MVYHPANMDFIFTSLDTAVSLMENLPEDISIQQQKIMEDLNMGKDMWVIWEILLQVMMKQQTWNDILEAMITVRQTHGWQ